MGRSRGFMNTITVSFTMVGWLALATGISGLLGFILIILFFTVGQSFGTLNDFFIGLTAILSVVLVWMSASVFQGQFPILGQVALVIATLGGILVLVGSVLALTGRAGWYLSGLFMAAGYGLIGLWLLVLGYSTLRGISIPLNLAIFALVAGLVLALGLVAIPGIFHGTDSQEYEFTLINSLWWAASLGYVAVYPVWSILLGRNLLLK
jgi:hypothetical protein